MDLVHELIKTDRGDLCRNHHDAKNEGEEWIAKLPVISYESIGRECGEVDGADSGPGGDDERVEKAADRVKGFAVEHSPVLRQMVGGYHRNSMLLNLRRVSCGVDDHDDKGKQAHHGQNDADDIDNGFVDGIPVSVFKFIHGFHLSSFCHASDRRL